MHVHTSPCPRLPRPGLILAAALSLALIPRGLLAGANEIAPRAAFTIQQQDQTSWLVSPDGRRFFSLGVCCVNQGVPPGEFDPANPSYAAWRRYADSNQWARATVERLKAWGFTTVGGWSDFQTLRQRPEHDLAFAPVLHIGATAGAPWWDMWDSRVLTRMDEVAREQILPLRDDPRVIGYYSDNEIGWWDAILFKATLEQAPGSGQRQRLLALLRQTYRDEWSELLRDFEPAPDLRGWEELEQHGVLWLRPGGRGIQVTRRFVTILAERYYFGSSTTTNRRTGGSMVRISTLAWWTSMTVLTRRSRPWRLPSSSMS